MSEVGGLIKFLCMLITNHLLIVLRVPDTVHARYISVPYKELKNVIPNMHAPTLLLCSAYMLLLWVYNGQISVRSLIILSYPPNLLIMQS